MEKNKDGHPYDIDIIQYVINLSIFDNNSNKNYQVLEVFGKAKEDNDKKDFEKDISNYYYIKVLGSLLSKEHLKTPQIIKVAGNTDLKYIYKKVKGNM